MRPAIWRPPDKGQSPGRLAERTGAHQGNWQTTNAVENTPSSLSAQQFIRAWLARLASRGRRKRRRRGRCGPSEWRAS